MPQLRFKPTALLFLAWLLLSIGLVYWGLFSLPFFVSPACGRLLFFPALGYGLGIATAWVLGMRSQAAPPGLPQRLLLLCLVPLLWAGVGYWSLAKFLPSALNAMLGQPYLRAYTVATVVPNAGHERCDHITVRELDERASYLPICVAAATIDTIQPGAKVWLGGKESWFGTSVSSYSYRAQP